MDREWMHVSNRVSQCFIKGLETFLETAVEYKKPENMSDVHYICCPRREHLLVRGFMSGYTCWTVHGEYKEVVLEDTDVGGDDDVDQMHHCWTEQNMTREDTNV
jgi:hypothetical protein